jgi:hypothetical protein
MVLRFLETRTNIEEILAAARFPSFTDASAPVGSRKPAGKIGTSGTLKNRRTVAIHALQAEKEQGKNAHGKAVYQPQEQAHQNQRKVGSQEQESGSVSGQ